MYSNTGNGVGCVMILVDDDVDDGSPLAGKTNEWIAEALYKISICQNSL